MGRFPTRRHPPSAASAPAKPYSNVALGIDACDSRATRGWSIGSTVIGPQVSITRGRALRVVDAVGAAGDQPGLVVQGLGAALVDAQPDRLEDLLALLADRQVQAHKRCERPRSAWLMKPIDEDRDIPERQPGSPAGRTSLPERAATRHPEPGASAAGFAGVLAGER